MKKIIASLALSVLCLAVTVGSFLTNDVAAYRDWATQNNPRMMDKIDRQIQNFSGDKSSQKKQKQETFRDDRHDDHDDHRDKRPSDDRHPDNRGDRSRFAPIPSQPPAPAPEAPAPSGNA